MKKVRVDLGIRSYDIIIEAGLLERAADFLREAGIGGPFMLVSNPLVYRLYGEKTVEALGKLHRCVVYAEVPDGEEYKNLHEAGRLFDIAVDSRLDRGSTVVALGGGVIGDLAGFVAATYQRGVNFVQIPTTLLAQVDSSVGGKVAVNHPRAKNMIGAFYQPRLVIIDPSVLSTLPEKEYLSGLAEVVKYGIILDAEFFAYIEENALRIRQRDIEVLEYIITRSCQIKSRVVSEDEREEGLRAVLNLGHTFGHAIEATAGYGTYSHGEAVAVGTVQAARLACELGLLKNDDFVRIKRIYPLLGMKLNPPLIPTEKLLQAMYHDKKIQRGTLRFVLPVAIGETVLRSDIAEQDVSKILDDRTLFSAE